MSITENARPVSAVDAFGVMTEYFYSAAGDLSGVTGPDTSVTVSHNGFGLPVLITDTLGRTVSRSYDKFNRPASAVDAFGVTTEYSYSPAGLPSEIKRWDSASKKTLFSSLKISYDSLGQVASVTDDQGRTKKYDRDALGRITAEYFPDDSVVRYAHTAGGSLREVTDQNGHKIQFAWSLLGKMSSQLTAAGQLTAMRYDKYGLLIGVDSALSKDLSKTDRSIRYNYDQFDRISKIDFGGGKTQTVTTDKRGRTVKVEAADGKALKTMSIAYDQFDRPAVKAVTETKDGKETSSLKYEYSYTPSGKRSGLTVTTAAGKRGMTWIYDKQGRLAVMKDGSKEVSYTYNGKSQITGQNIAGTGIYYTYTAQGQLEGKYMGSVENPIASVKYLYGKDGSVAARAVNGELQKYEYDKKGQLLAVRDAKGSAVEDYLYDAAGNILRKTVEGKTTCFEYDGANQLVKAVLPDGSVRDYAYDAAGRMTKDGDKTYSYGWLNKVMSISENGQTASTFDYTIEGQLSKKTSGSTEETFLWDDLALIGRNGSEFTVEPYVTGGNPIMAGDKVLFNDMLGTTLGAAGKDGFTAIKRDAFGQVLSNPLGEQLNFFTGKPQIGGLGYAFLFRNYDSHLGKWTAQDPLGYPDGWNNFAYCNNWATIGIDNTGMRLSIGFVTNPTFTDNTSNPRSISVSVTSNGVIGVLESDQNYLNVTILPGSVSVGITYVGYAKINGTWTKLGESQCALPLGWTILD